MSWMAEWAHPKLEARVTGFFLEANPGVSLLIKSTTLRYDVVIEQLFVNVKRIGQRPPSKGAPIKDRFMSDEKPKVDFSVKVKWTANGLATHGLNEEELHNWLDGLFGHFGIPELGSFEWGYENGLCSIGSDLHGNLAAVSYAIVNDPRSEALDAVLVSEGMGYEDMLAYHRHQLAAIARDV